MGKRVTVPISIARKELFHLTDLVRRSGDETAVVLEQRGGREPVALVREARLAYLEAQVRELQHRHDVSPFELAGSLSTPLDDRAVEDALRQLREGWTSDAVAKDTARKATRRKR